MPELVIHKETHLFKHVVVTVMPTGIADANQPSILAYINGSTTASIDYTYTSYDAATQKDKPLVLRACFNPASTYMGTVVQINSENCKILNAEVVSDPMSVYDKEILVKYLDIVYSGQPTIKFFLDGSAKEIDIQNIDTQNAGTFRGTVLDKDLTTPPTEMETGDKYIVAAGATGAWATHDGKVAEWDGASWSFTVPTTGDYVNVVDEYIHYIYFASAWVVTDNADELQLANVDLSTTTPKTKRVYLPNAGMRGYIPQLWYTAGAAVYSYTFGLDDPQKYVTKQFFHSAEIVYTGTPEVRFEVDGQPLKVLDGGSIAESITLPATAAGAQSTHIVYFAPASTGYFPSFREANTISNSNHIINVNYNSAKV